MGIKPLYYVEHDGELLFGSELKCIFAHPEVPRNLCMAGLNCYLSLNYVPAPYTLVEGIRKLLPGHVMEWRNGKASVQSYVRKESATPAPHSIAEATEELDDLLQKSVCEQLVSDVPVGIWLSGGLDSSTILRYAAEAGTAQLRTFSITFKGRSFDESASIAQTSRHFGSKHTEFDLDETADLENAIEKMAYYSDEPSADAGALPAWFLAKMSSKDVTVVLTGEGADELFAGYLTYKADRYAAAARRVPAGLRRAAFKCAGLLPVSDDKISFEYKVKRFLQGSLLSPEMAHVFWNGTFTEGEKRQFFRFADSGPLDSILQNMSRKPGLQRYLDFDQRYYLADDILYKVDRMSMAHSLEARPPFLDPRIVDFAARLPERFKLNGSQSKYVLRRLMQDKLPPNVLRRPKIGFDIPVHDWFRSVLRPMLLDTLSEDAVRATGLFNWNAVEQLLSDHLERKANLGYHLWGLMVLLLWMKQWNVGTGEQRSSSERSRPRIARSGWIVVAVACFVFLINIASPPRLMDDVDAVQAQIARNMLDSGDYVTARLDGVAYLEKAPLVYWMMAASYKIFGVHDWAARLPLALAVVLLCFVTYRFGRWAFGDRAGMFAGIVLATSVGLFLFTRILIPDAMLTLTITGAIWAWLRLLEPDEEHPHRWAVIMGLYFGAGLLLKGLIAVVFPILAGLAFMAVTRQLFRGAAWKKLDLWLVAAIALLIAAPWHILAAIANPPAFAFSCIAVPVSIEDFSGFTFSMNIFCAS